jgi:small-conductance mechanosensitive channel
MEKDCELGGKNNLCLLETQKQLLKNQDTALKSKLDNNSLIKQHLDRINFVDAETACIEREIHSFKESNIRLGQQGKHLKQEMGALK